MPRVPVVRMLMVMKLLRKLPVEQAKLLLKKRKRKKILTSTSSGSRRNRSLRRLLVKSPPGRSLARCRW